jgi:hypothetical protein
LSHRWNISYSKQFSGKGYLQGYLGPLEDNRPPLIV